MRKKKRIDHTIRSAPSNRKGKPPKTKAVRKAAKKKVVRKSKVEKNRNAGTMSEAAYWQMIRSALRNKTRFWKPRLKALESARRASQSDNKRLKWEFQCSVCNKWHPQTQVEVHHEIAAGTLKCGADLEGFVERLFAETGWEVTCKKCHKEFHDNEKLLK